MKKIGILLYATIFSLSLAGCGSAPYTQADETVEEAEESAALESLPESEAQSVTDTEETDTEAAWAGEETTACLPDEEGFYTLYPEDEGDEGSVRLRIPERFEASPYLSETWLECYRREDGGTLVVHFYLTNKTEAEAEERLRQEVTLTFGLNQAEEYEIGGTQQFSTETLKASYFPYFFTCKESRIEGGRVWAALDNGSMLTASFERKGSGPEPLQQEEIEAILSEALGEAADS